ncbi:flagellar protein FliT [Pullulanibacillus sp. KACC 23026]|uniref:flagellar protein FliT n=1 Tax=Pullulanibacillus sp. KACC 23026 TaxID=3028315 RepID=UPI0023B027CD|nr:flagellar protein FliT [Pullulanibacillus sp. KACC 23026]WEG11242.1 flagellar protein FliT [Pullulanibacillus sp. KACC 23026]
MERLIEEIYEITKKMNQTIKLEDYQGYHLLLQDRQARMEEVDRQKAELLNFQPTKNLKLLLKEILDLDHEMKSLLEKSIQENQRSIQQVKRVKKFTKGYQPRIQQTNGVFFDRKK